MSATNAQFDEWWGSQGRTPWHKLDPVMTFEAGMAAAGDVWDALDELFAASGAVSLADPGRGVREVDRLIAARSAAYKLLRDRPR